MGVSQCASPAWYISQISSEQDNVINLWEKRTLSWDTGIVIWRLIFFLIPKGGHIGQRLTLYTYN